MMRKELKRLLKHFEKEVAANIYTSAIGLAICPKNADEIDAKICLEIGAMILLNKPIILCIPPGSEIPEKLAKVVDEFVEYKPNDNQCKKALVEAIHRMEKQL